MAMACAAQPLQLIIWECAIATGLAPRPTILLLLRSCYLSSLTHMMLL